MPNIKRRFADDDPSTGDEEEDDDDEPQYYRGGGKGIRMPGGKAFRPPPADDDDDDDDDDSDDDDDDDDDQPPSQSVYRGGGGGGGKQLRAPGGKQLRPQAQQEDSEEESDDDDDDLKDDEPIRPVQRGGGKALMRMRAPDDEEEEESSSEEEEPQPQRIMQRGGGKSLMRMQAPPDDDDDESEEEEEEPQVQRPVQRGGGKALSRMTAARGGGKQLRPPAQDDDDDEEEEESESEEEVKKPVATQIVRRGGGKSLMRMQAPSEEEEESDSEDEADVAEKTKEIAQPEPKVEAPTATLKAEPEIKAVGKIEDGKSKLTAGITGKAKQKPTIQASPRGGKQLRRPQPKDDSDDEVEFDEESDVDDDEDFGDDDMDVESDAEVKPKTKPEPKKKPPARKAPPRKAAATKVVESDGMEESDEDEESDDEEMELDMETFDTQRLVADEADQKYLDSLPEVEREAILAERFEKRKAELDMKKALKDAKRKEREDKSAATSSTKKQKTAATKKALADKKAKEDEEAAILLASKRESGRNKDATGKKASKAKALAALREERKKVMDSKDESGDSEDDFGEDDDDSDDDYEDASALKPWQRKAAKSTVSRLDRMQNSDDEDDGGGDDVEDEPAERSSVPKMDTADVEADLLSYQKITLPRRRLARWCNEPFFKEAVMDCYVKLFIGVNEDGKRCYRLCRIVAVNTHPATYSLPPEKKEKPISTDKMLRLKFGKNERDFPIKLASDNKVVEDDMNQYITAMKSVRATVLTKREANKIRRLQDELVNNYVYTTQDIEHNLRERKKKGKTASNYGSEQTRVLIAVEAARGRVDDLKFKLDKAREADLNSPEAAALANSLVLAEQELEEREEEKRALDSRMKDRVRALSGRSKDQKWAKVNERARQTNQQLDLEAYKEKEDEIVAALGPDGKPRFNPYARRKVKPKILWEVGQEDDTEVAADDDAAKKADAAKAFPADVVTAAPTLVQEHQEKANALSQSHQFNIDEEFLAQSSNLMEESKAPAKKRVRRGISLKEYFERKAAGTL